MGSGQRLDSVRQLHRLGGCLIMVELGTIEYRIKPTGCRFKVVSATWTKGFGGVGWFENYVAEVATIKEATDIIERLTNG